MGIHSITDRGANCRQGATCSCSAPIEVLSVRTEARRQVLHGVCTMCGSRAVMAITATNRQAAPSEAGRKGPPTPSAQTPVLIIGTRL